MKKKFLSLLLIGLLCCTAFCFVGCYEGHEMGTMTCKAELSYTKRTAAEIQDVDLRDIIATGTGFETAQLTLTGATFSDGTTSVNLSDVLAKGGKGTFSGFDVLTVGTRTMQVSYEGYTCQVTYTVS